MSIQRKRPVCWLLIVLFLILPLSSEAAVSKKSLSSDGSTSNTMTIQLSDDTIVEIEKSSSGVRTRTYVNNVLFESAVGTSSKIELTVYDGSTNSAVERRKAPTGHVIEKRHTSRSKVRFMGKTTKVYKAVTKGVDTEPWFTSSGLTSVGSDWYSLGSTGGHPLAPAMTGDVQRKMTKTYVRVSNSWTWGIGESVTVILTVISLAISPPVTYLAWILTGASISQNVLTAVFSPNLDEYTFTYDYRVMISGKSYHPYQRKSRYWFLNSSPPAGDWKLKSHDVSAVSNSQQVVGAIDDWLKTHTHDTCKSPCSVCGSGTGNAHKWGSWTTTTKATCTATGTEKRTCTKNSAHYETRSIATLGHSWGSWTTTKSATCTVAGSKKRVCTRDSAHTQTEAIAALGHNYPSAWSNTSISNHTKKCSRCTSTLQELHKAMSGSTYCACGRKGPFVSPNRLPDVTE